MVTVDADLLPPGTLIDLDNCAREPIHVPGSIQPRGVLIEVSDPDFVVRQVSENLAGLVGVPWQEALGRPLAEAPAPPTDRVLRQAERAILDTVEHHAHLRLRPALTR